MNYESKIREILGEDVEIYEVGETSNKVFKVNTGSKIVYVKFYRDNSSHVDNELKIYDLVSDKYLKEVVYKSDSPKMAIFGELVGKTIDELSREELDNNSDKIVDSIIDYFTSISSNKTTGYGLLDDNLCGKSNDFIEFLRTRQKDTSDTLKDYPELSSIADELLDKYSSIIESDNSLVPIDTNMKNVMVCDDGSIKFVDPGEMISGPILMGYGDFAAHTYKTVLYDKLVEKLDLSSDEEKLIRIYAIFSSLNILAFLRKLGVTELDKVIPFGNSYTFYDLISEHLEYLGSKRLVKKTF